MTATTSTPTVATTTPEPRFGEHALNLDAYAAGFAAVRRAMPTPPSEAFVVQLFPDAIDAWLKAAPVTLAGRRDGGR